MEFTITQNDLKNIYSYNNKKFINILKELTDEQINILIDSDIVELISLFNANTINSIFRNSNATMQNKLWTNDTIQRILILGTTNIDSFVCTQQTIRNLQNLKKVIKSQAIKKQIFKNKYFLMVVMYGNKIEPIFFHSYDIKKVFENVVSSEEFKVLPNYKQFTILEKLNHYTDGILLPNDFRERYHNIESILLETNREKIDSNIMEQLNDEELFLLDYLNTDVNNNDAIKNYLLDNIKNKGKSFEEFLADIKDRDNLIQRKIREQYKREFYYNKVSLEQKVYHILLHEIQDEIIKEKLLKYLIDHIIKNSSINPEIVYNSLKRNLNNGLLDYIDVKRLMYNSDIVTNDLKIIFYLKTNISLSNSAYLYGISKEQLSKLNIKHINKLSKFLEDKTQDELSLIYGICIKMYLIFGYERCIEILSEKYGKYNKTFLDNVSKTIVNRVSMKAEGNKYLPVIDQRFINFMFETTNKNHFINMLNDKSSELYKTWYYLYNNYDKILDKCHNKITLKKVIAILEIEKYDVDRKIITPDNYLLNNNSFIENIVLGNITHNSNDHVLATICDVYSKMKKRVESSIPYVKGTALNGYKYQMMKFDDPQAFELGYKANCCIRTLDIAHNHLLHATLCRNGRILLIYDKLEDLAAFCPLKRNGNVLIVNSIECVDEDKIDISGSFITDAFKEAIENIVMISKKSKEPIELVCIGDDAYLKPTTIPFPKNYQTPTILEKDDELYKNTDKYHKKLDIVYKAANFDFKNIKSKNPEASYMDPRNEIKYVDFSTERYNIDSAINLINSINYSINKENYIPISRYSIKCVYYSKDWYIADTNHGIIGECLENDYRAKEEFDDYMNMLNKIDRQKVLK